MNSHLPPLPIRTPARFCPRRGAALIVVLGAVMLLTVIVLAFFSSVRTDYLATRYYADGSSVRTLSDSVVQLVQAQIREATTNSSGTWASQPGMIRTFNRNGTDGSVFRLYSWETMKSTSVDQAAELNTLKSWSKFPAVFANLNDPITVNSTSVYPIINPNLADGAIIPGFNVMNSVSDFGTNAPMPVRWLYVLSDGRIVSPGTPSGSSSNQATFASGAGITPANPIVARVAFWADDETCKVNINTASQPTYSSSPFGRSQWEKDLAEAPPYINEYQRYPGHPAMVSLLSVFPTNVVTTFIKNGIVEESFYGGVGRPGIVPRIQFGGSKSGSVKALANQSGSSSIIQLDTDRLYASVDELMFATNKAIAGATRLQNNPVLTRDLISGMNFLLTANSRAPEITMFNTPRMSLWPRNPLDYNSPEEDLMKFCSTVGLSNYTYLFERTTIWTNRTSAGVAPWGGDGKNLPYLGGSALDPTFEIDPTRSSPFGPVKISPFARQRNLDLYLYMKRLADTPIPGYGNKFKDKYGIDTDQIVASMFEYVRGTVNPTRGAFKNSAGKDVSGFRYADAPDPYYTSRPGEWNVYALDFNDADVRARTQTPNEARGIGRNVTISEVALIFYPTVTTLVTNTLDAGSPKETNEVSLVATEMGCYLLVEPFLPVLTFPWFEPNFAFEIQNLDAIEIRAKDPLGNILGQAGGNSYRLDRTASGSKMNIRRLINQAAVRVTVGTPNDVHQAFMGILCPFFKSVKSNNGKDDIATPRIVRDTYNQPAGDAYLNPVSGYPFNWEGIRLHTNVGGTFDIVITTNASPIRLISLPGPTAIDSDSKPLQTIELPFSTVTNLPVPLSGLGERRDAGDLASIAVYETNLYRRIAWISTNIMAGKETGNVPIARNLDLVRPVDTVRSVEFDGSSGSPARGDFRLLAARRDVPTAYFNRFADYPLTNVAQVHSLRTGSGQTWGGVGDWSRMTGIGSLVQPPGFGQPYQLPLGIKMTNHPPLAVISGSIGKIKFAHFGHPYVARPLDTDATAASGAMMRTPSGNDRPGDFTSNVGKVPDGGQLATADYLDRGNNQANVGTYGKETMYYIDDTIGDGAAEAVTGKSPLKQITSAVSFGTLPTGVLRGRPWQTLLFCPNPASRKSGAKTTPVGRDEHEGFITPPDHLLLDWWWIPIVEPYAISEPFSTAGKINLNSTIMPFSYIERTTALRAILADEKITAITAASARPDGSRNAYKTRVQYTGIFPNSLPLPPDNITANQYDYRYSINVSATLAGWTNRFFKSATEVCELFLVPSDIPSAVYAPGAAATSGLKYEDMNEWWSGNVNDVDDGFALTGDNLREQPYGNIYPKLTTKSNTYTIHMRVQALKQNPANRRIASDWNTWSDDTDMVASEFRGSSTIERYIDLSDPTRFPDYATVADPADPANNLNRFYRFRVVNEKQFAP